ncbi:MAG: hypothetical protein WBC77_04980 [Candidatus Zixiibacteriota bacterium]|jgi:hypothetical protein
MGVKSNFVSVVSVGCFNPAILTPQFLKEKCEFTAYSEPKGRTTPVATGLDYGSILFLLDLERFQIKHSDLKRFQDSNIVTIMMDYLRVLQHTPLDAIGVNLNYDIAGQPGGGLLKRLLEKEKALSEFLELSESVTVHKVRRKIDEPGEIIEVDLSGPLDENTIERLNITARNQSLRVNYNHEIKNLRKNRKLLARMKTDWPSLLDKDEQLRRSYFEEDK